MGLYDGEGRRRSSDDDETSSYEVIEKWVGWCLTFGWRRGVCCDWVTPYYVKSVDGGGRSLERSHMPARSSIITDDDFIPTSSTLTSHRHQLVSSFKSILSNAVS